MSILKFGLGFLLGSLPAFIQLSAQVSGGGRAIQIRPTAQQSMAQESRVALVIGNGAYADAPLCNPVNDARAIKIALESCRFEVTLLTNAPKREMENAIRVFGDRIQNGSVGLFYFAGHGIQVKGVNYLVPVGADNSMLHLLQPITRFPGTARAIQVSFSVSSPQPCCPLPSEPAHFCAQRRDGRNAASR